MIRNMPMASGLRNIAPLGQMDFQSAFQFQMIPSRIGKRRLADRTNYRWPWGYEMPISTRVLTKQNQQASGRWRVREVHTDALGVDFTFQYLAASVAEATTNMNSAERAAETVAILVDRDIQEVIVWVEARNTPASFDYTDRDIDSDRGEEEVAKHFARSPGEVALLFAWWIESLGPPAWTAIATRLGWSTAADEIGDRVQVRAQDLTVAEDSFYQTESV